MWLVAPAGATLIRCLGWSWRIDVRAREHLEAARRVGPAVIFAFWHGRLLALSYAHRNENIHVLASEHRDGEMLGRTIRFLGYGHVRGSSTRGGTRALTELADVVRRGVDVGLTVDGPRGPRFVAKAGAVEVARRTGAAIIPLTSASRSHKTFSSWDAFELPRPLTRVVVRYGPPIVVPPDADREAQEAARLELERTLLAITREADREAGR